MNRPAQVRLGFGAPMSTPSLAEVREAWHKSRALPTRSLTHPKCHALNDLVAQA